jgi:hypothetical protein
MILALRFPVTSNTSHKQQQHIIGKTKKKNPKTKTLQLPFTKRAFQSVKSGTSRILETVEHKKLFLLLQEVLFFWFSFFLVVIQQNCEVRECKCFPSQERRRRRQQQQQEEEEEKERRRDKEDEDDEGPDGFGDQIWT